MDWRKEIAWKKGLAEVDALVEEMQGLSFKNEETDPFTKAIFDSIVAYSCKLNLSGEIPMVIIMFSG